MNLIRQKWQNGMEWMKKNHRTGNEIPLLGIFFNIDATTSKNIPLFHNKKLSINMQYIINNVFSNHDQNAAKILNYIEMCFYVDHKCGIAVSKIAIDFQFNMCLIIASESDCKKPVLV